MIGTHELRVALTVDDFLPLEGWKETSATKLIAAIEASKSRPLGKLVFGLGIDHVGGTVAGVLARRFRSIDALAAASIDEISDIDGIGPEIAGAVDAWFSDPDNRHLIERLGEAGVSLRDEGDDIEDLPQVLAGLTVVITGTLEGYTRDTATAAVVARGGRVVGSVSSRTSAVIAGENAGSKLAKAESLGVPVLDEAAFSALLERGAEALPEG